MASPSIPKEFPGWVRLVPELDSMVVVREGDVFVNTDGNDYKCTPETGEPITLVYCDGHHHLCDFIYKNRQRWQIYRRKNGLTNGVFSLPAPLP